MDSLIVVYSNENVVCIAAPPSAPLNFNAIDITSKSVTLQWVTPSSTGGTELTGLLSRLLYLLESFNVLLVQTDKK